MKRSWGLAVAVVASALAACAPEGETSAPASSGPTTSIPRGEEPPRGGSTPAPSSIIDAAARAKLLELSPSTLPPAPPDATNEVADDPKAALFGQALFFDAGFSGPLLESDNDGKHQGVGLQGETGKVSCASCHVAKDGFSDTRTVFKQISLASGWTRRRTPSILDVGQAKLLMWDGRFDTLQRQILAVFESPMEGNGSRLFFAQEIARRYATQYAEVFDSDPTVVLGGTYPKPTASQTGCQMPLTSSTTPDEACSGGTKHGVPGAADYDALTADQQRAVTTIALNAGKAIAAYERLLTCGQSRFDAFMHGDAKAMNPSEQRGAALFVGKAKCVDCHSGPYFSDQKFHNVGLFPGRVAAAFIHDDDRGAEVGLAQVLADPLNVKGSYARADDGRLPASVPAEALGAFRTPMLRCSATRPSFMHTAQMKTLKEVVTFFDKGGHVKKGAPVPAGVFGDNEIDALGLGEREVDDLVAFLGALQGPGPAASLLVAPP